MTLKVAPLTKNMAHTATAPPIRGKLSIQEIIAMPTWAARFTSLILARFLASRATCNVHLVSHPFQVGWVYTTSIAAEMVKFRRDLIECQFVTKAVGEAGPPRRPHAKAAISIFIPCGFPKPTGHAVPQRACLVNFCPKARDGRLGVHRRISFHDAVERDGYNVAAPLAYHTCGAYRTC